MTRRHILAIAAVAALLLFTLGYARHVRRGEGSPAADTHPASAAQVAQPEVAPRVGARSAPSLSVPASNRPRRTTYPDIYPVDLSAERPAVLALAPLDRRPGESDVDFEVRSSQRAMLVAFVERGKLDDAQRQQLYGLIYDASIHWRLAMNEMVKSHPDGLLKTLVDDLDEQIRSGMAEVLSAEQMELFDDMLPIPSALAAAEGLIVGAEAR